MSASVGDAQGESVVQRENRVAEREKAPKLPEIAVSGVGG